MSLAVLLVLSFVAGTWMFRALGLGGAKGPEGLALRLLAGLSLCAVLVLCVGSASLRIAELVVYLVALAGLGHELLVRSKRRSSHGQRRKVQPPLGFLEYAGLLAVAGALGLSLIGALAPVTSWDACVAHLALPQDYAMEGRIFAFEGNEYSGYPHLMHSLFAFAFLGGGETAVTLLSWAFGLLACLAAFALGQRVEGRRCGILAAAILATTPVFIDQAGTASLDLAFTGFALASLACLMAWRDEEGTGWLALGAFLAGSACGIRHTGYLVCVLLGIGVLLTAREHRFRAALCFGGVALLAAAPWLVRSAIVSGNPFYPFLSTLFGSDRMPHRNITALAAHESIRGVTLERFLLFPWDIVMRPHWFDGWSKSPGGLVLFLGIPGLVVGSWRARTLGAFSIAGGVCFFFFQQSARYLLPFFAPMMVVAAVAACHLRTLRYGVAVVLIAAFGYGLALDAGAIHFKLPVVFGLESREDYLTRRVERYPAFVWVSENVPREDTVLTFDRRTYYMKGRTYQNDESLKPLRDLPVAEQIEWFERHEIKWVLVPITFIEESPGYRADFLAMVKAWKQRRRHFEPVKIFDLADPRSNGRERVELYKVKSK